MPWLQIAGMGLNILGAGASASAQKYAAKAQASNQYQQALIAQQREYSQLQAGLRVQEKQNKEVVRADLQSLVNTSYTSGLLNLQRSMQKQQTAAELQMIGKTRIQAAAQAEVSAAATGTVGDSVKAVQSDIASKAGEASILAWERNSTNSLNTQIQLRNLYQGYLDNQGIIDDSVPDIPGLPPKYGAVPVSVSGAMLGAGISYLGKQLASGMTLGTLQNPYMGGNLNSPPRMANVTFSGPIR